MVFTSSSFFCVSSTLKLLKYLLNFQALNNIFQVMFLVFLPIDVQLRKQKNLKRQSHAEFMAYFFVVLFSLRSDPQVMNALAALNSNFNFIYSLKLQYPDCYFLFSFQVSPLKLTHSPRRKLRHKYLAHLDVFSLSLITSGIFGSLTLSCFLFSKICKQMIFFPLKIYPALIDVLRKKGSLILPTSP